MTKQQKTLWTQLFDQQSYWVLGTKESTFYIEYSFFKKKSIYL